MRFVAMIVGAGMALLSMAVPAEAQWKSYISKPMGFSFEAPGTVTAAKGVVRGANGSQRESIVYKSSEDNIEYSVTVVSYGQGATDSAKIMSDAYTEFQKGKRVLFDTDARVESIASRKMGIERPNNGGRGLAAFYFNNGYLLQLEATVLPANGDYGSPDPGRFIDSIAFSVARAEEGSIELKLP